MRYYSSTASEKTLTSSLSDSAATMVLSDTSGLPSVASQYPFTLVIDPDVDGKEEIVLVTGMSGTTATIVRGITEHEGVPGGNGTSPVAHDAGAKVRHMVTARDLQEPQNHMAASSNVHGVTGSLVGTTAAQTLTNKTISSASNTITVGISNVTNLQSSLDAKAPLASPVLTGNPTVSYGSTPPVSEDSATIATTAWVQDVADTKLDEPAGNGIAVRTSAGNVANRSIAAGSGITVTNGDGVSGNPTISAVSPVQSGTVTVTYTSGTGTATVTSATTTAGSIIVATAAAAEITVGITSIGTNTFTVAVQHRGTASGSVVVRWIVV